MRRHVEAAFARLTLARKLTGISVITTAASLVVACAVFMLYDFSSARDDLARSTGMLADVIGRNSTAALAFGDAKAADEILEGVAEDTHIVAAMILSREGRPLARYQRNASEKAASPYFPMDALLHGRPWHAFTQGSLMLLRPIVLGREVVGAVFIQSDQTEIWARATALGRIAAGVMFGTFWLAFAVAFRLQRVISAPLLKLTEITRLVTQARQYDVRAESGGHGEIGELVEGFNRMLGEIEQRDRTLLRHKDDLEASVEARTAELRAANAEMNAALDKAMEASRAKSEFLANMSHEIRTPMNGIIGMAELALGNDLNADTRECLDTVKTSAESLLAILNDILDFSKIESRKLELESVPFVIADVISEMLKPFAVRADQKGLELIVDIGEHVPEAVQGDPGRLQQILANLIGNAIKFTASGQVLVELREETRGNGCTRLHFMVSDTGIGIPVDKHETIFEAFSQADGSTTRRFGGTGLGLTISTTLVRLMGGTIWLDSEPDAGTTFHFTIPFDIVQAPVVAHSRLSPAKPDLGGVASARILLAEDNVVNQRVAVGLLARRGHRVTVVANGCEAVAALESERYDLVLMDVQMPEMGGIEATALIREQERHTGQRTRIIAMTAHAMTGDRERCLAAGMDGYLPKPINQASLYEVVERGSDGSVPAAQGTLAFNQTALLERLGGDQVLMLDIIRLFLADCPRRLGAIKAAVDARDGQQIRSTAHALRGSAGTLSAVALADAAHTLERLGAEARFEAAEAAWRTLSTEAASLMTTLRQIEGTAPYAR